MNFAISPETVLIAVLTFCRVGTVFMFLPALGESNVPMNIRLIIAVVISLLVAPTLSVNDIKVTSSPLYLLLIVGVEVALGVAIGLMTKLLLSAVHVLGFSIGTYSGLSSAILFDPSQNSQGSIFGNFFTLITIACILAADLHLLIISGVAHSYHKFPLASFHEHVGDFSELISQTTSMAFNVGIQISAPFILVSIALSVAAGVIAKLIPQIQIFFLVLPAQVLLAFIILLLTFSGIVMWFIEFYREQLTLLFSV